VQLPFRLSSAIYRMGQQLTKERRGWIPLVFLLAWSKGGAKPGELVAGAGPEVFRKFLDQISAVGASGSFESA